MVADDDVLADVSVVADFAIFADDGRAFDHHAVLDHRAFADKNALVDEYPRARMPVRGGADMGFDIILEPLEGVPGKFAPVEKLGMPGLAQIKQITRLEHVDKVRETVRLAMEFR